MRFRFDILQKENEFDQERIVVDHASFDAILKLIGWIQ